MAKNKNTTKTHHDYTDSFYSDLIFPDMYYASLLRHTENGIPVQSIIIPETLTDKLLYFSNSDCPGKKTVSSLNSEIKIFAEDTADYIGECAGIICDK